MCPYCGTPWCIHQPNWHPYGRYHGMHPPFPGCLLVVVVAVVLAFALFSGAGQGGDNSPLQESQPGRQNIQPERSGSDDR